MHRLFGTHGPPAMRKTSHAPDVAMAAATAPNRADMQESNGPNLGRAPHAAAMYALTEAQIQQPA